MEIHFTAILKGKCSFVSQKTTVIARNENCYHKKKKHYDTLTTVCNFSFDSSPEGKLTAEQLKLQTANQNQSDLPEIQTIVREPDRWSLIGDKCASHCSSTDLAGHHLDSKIS